MLNKPVWIMLLTTLAYAVAGRLALLLAIPPGYATAIWPAAGIALAVLLLCGYRFWPAVVAGSFLVNAPGALVLGQGAGALLVSAQTPLLIGSGAALQALFSVWLLRRFVSYPVSLDTTASVLKFIVLVCGLGSTVSASVGVLALLAGGQLAASNALYNWFTWWVGDGLGVMLVATLIFVFWAEPRGIWRSRRRLLPPVLLLASLVMVVLYVLASRWEMARQQGGFERHASQLYQQTEAVLRSYFESLYAVQAFFATTDAVSAADFERFVRGTLARNAGFQGIAWNRVVAHSERAALEKALSEELGEAVVLTEVDQNGTRMRAAERDSYVVIRYIQPLEHNRAAPGYDISASPAPRRALLNALRRAPAATSPIRLVQETGEQLGVVVYFPVVREDGRLRGYAAGVFRLGDLMETVLANESLRGLSLCLVSGGAKPQTLYSKGEGRCGQGALFSRAWEVQFADQRWRLEVAGGQSYLVGSRSIIPWGMLVTGLLFVGLLGMWLLVLTGAKFRSEESGRELTRMLAQLRETQGQLVEAEKLAALGGMVAGFAHELNTPIGIAITAESTLAADLRQLEELELERGVDEESSERRQSLLRRMREASTMVLDNLQRAGNLIDSFKQVSVDQAGADMRRINLYDYLHDLLLHLSPNYRRGGHEVHFDCPRDIYLQTVPGGLAQVVVNLMNNAINHAFAPGQSGCIRLWAEREGEEVLLHFSDDGVGMPEAVCEHVFEPFFTTRRGGRTAGSGLGLHLVYNIVRRQLGGDIRVSSTLGEGSCFTLRLPLSAEEGTSGSREARFDALPERRSGFM
ncbi:CHASE domain-containing protein [Spongiibacter sp.]|uniref:CHASE domain-containing protein n=1 Tax=Spongiibacter sp. TaxID=2024860 RepID=UPI003567C214